MNSLLSVKSRIAYILLLVALLLGGLEAKLAMAASEVCVDEGGKRSCTDPKPSPWTYHLCDNVPAGFEAWKAQCEGFWKGTFVPTNVSPGWRCDNPDLPIIDEGELKPRSKVFAEIRHMACQQDSPGFSGWQGAGETIDGGSLCYGYGQPDFQVGPVYKQGVETRNYANIFTKGLREDPQTGQCSVPWERTVYVDRRLAIDCPVGYEKRTIIDGTPGGRLICVISAESCPVTSNPIRPGLGAKIDTIIDYQSAAPGNLRLTRYYYSFSFYFRPIGYAVEDVEDFAVMGGYWQTNYDARIFSISDSDYIIAYAQRPNGTLKSFDHAGQEILNISGPLEHLEKLTDGAGELTGWRYTTAQDVTETYNANGKLSSLIDRAGRIQTLIYSDATTPTTVAPKEGFLIGVTDHFGRTLSFTYNSDGQRISMTDPAGQLYQYTYDTNNNLETVTYPNDSVKRYHYEDIDFPGALTGITDENENRYATYGYDSTGRAVLSEHAGGVEKSTLDYHHNNTTTVTDPLGTERLYSYTEINGVLKNTSISQPCTSCGGSAASTEYDADGFVTRKTDFNGNITTYSFDDRGRQIQRIEAFGSTEARTISTAWHPSFNLPTSITKPGRLTTFSYDTQGNLLSRTETDTSTSAARTWAYTYNTIGQVISMDGPRTDVVDVTTYSYDAAGNRIQITDALGKNTTITAHDAHGRPLTMVDPNNVATTLNYDLLGRLLSRSQASETTDFDYEPTGKLSRITLPDGSFTDYQYDAAQRLTTIEDNLGNRIEYTLDLMGNTIKTEIFDPQGTLTQTQQRVFDNLSRLKQHIGADNQITDYSYDDNGNIIQIIDPLNHPTTQYFDALDRLVQITDPEQGQTSWGYDALDQLLEVTDPRNNTTQYTVNALGQQTQQLSPDTGTTNTTVDPAGNRLSQTDAKNQTSQFSYDALNRVTQLTYHDSSIVTYQYDQGLNGQGRLTQLSDASGSISFSYDELGRVGNETRTMANHSYTTDYEYSQGRLLGMTYPSGRNVDYTFDALGRSQSISTTQDGVSTTVISGVSYQPFAGVKAFNFGNGDSYSRSYDLDGRIISYNLAESPQTLTYDRASQIIGQSGDNIAAPSLPDTNENYTISATSNRLTAISGTRTATLNYDANGSIIADDQYSYVYDARGRLIQVNNTALGTVDYQINALGQRVVKTTSTETTVYHYNQQGQLIAESDALGTVWKEYLYLGTQPVAMIDDGTLYYLHADHLDTTRVITDSLGNVVWRWVSDPFGEVLPDEDPDNDGQAFTFNLRFPGQYYDLETGLHYNYHRDYDPATGRYVESDPIGLWGGINTYAYVGGNPLGRIDFFGLESPIDWDLTGPPEECFPECDVPFIECFDKCLGKFPSIPGLLQATGNISGLAGLALSQHYPYLSLCVSTPAIILGSVGSSFAAFCAGSCSKNPCGAEPISCPLPPPLITPPIFPMIGA